MLISSSGHGDKLELRRTQIAAKETVWQAYKFLKHGLIAGGHTVRPHGGLCMSESWMCAQPNAIGD